MSSRFEFKATAVRIVLYLMSINGLVAIALFLSRTPIRTALVVIGLVNIAYLSTVIFKPFKIVIDQDKLLLEVHYLSSILRRRKIIPLQEVKCSFNYEVRARGGKAKVLKIMYDNKPAVELLPDYNGWGIRSLTQIFEKLNDLKKVY